MISNEDVICIVEDILFTFYFSGLADRAANLPPITFVSPCTFPPQMPWSCWALANAWRLCWAGGLQWTSFRVLGEPNAKCGKTLQGGNTGAWKMLGMWLHIDFILMFDMQSGNNVPVAIHLKTYSTIQNKCQCLPSMRAAFWFTQIIWRFWNFGCPLLFLNREKLIRMSWNHC